MAYDPITTAEIQVKQPVTQALMQKIKNDIDYLYAAQSPGWDIVVRNPSLEIDSDSDGIPDSWSRTLYPGGSGSFETTSPMHGAKSYKFVHPGGGGNGGGYLVSDYIEISQLMAPTQALGWLMYSSVAGIKNIVQIAFYTAAKVIISSTDLYNSTSNPTTPTYFIRPYAIPANARFMKILLVGGYTDTAVAGTTYFDYITLTGVIFTNLQWEFSEVSTSSDTYVDIASITIANIVGYVNINVAVEFRTSDASYNWYARLRIGSAMYGTEINSNNTTYATFELAFAGGFVNGEDTLYLQLHRTITGTVYARKSSSVKRLSCTLRPCPA